MDGLETRRRALCRRLARNKIPARRREREGTWNDLADINYGRNVDTEARNIGRAFLTPLSESSNPLSTRESSVTQTWTNSPDSSPFSLETRKEIHTGVNDEMATCISFSFYL